ncbi:RepB family protein [Aeromonas sp. EERV15]|uniref:RepB family protein n=1 Tax=Aeromonas sp. EERV15 TaxID=1833892 RepID=UPI00083A852C|nr:RepB family protein [Aeromonas sp. EERV15]
MSHEIAVSDAEEAVPQNNAERQRQHVKRKQETHTRLQCWISNRHAERLADLGIHLEDSQASLIEQAIDLLYQHELGRGSELENTVASLVEETVVEA